MKSRKQERGAPADRPQAAQSDAIRRLIRHGDLPEADKRLRLLRTRFPDFKPLCGLAFEIAAASGNRSLMRVEAWAWTQAAPNSIAAWSALADSTAGDSMVLHRAALQRLDGLSGVPARPFPPLDSHPYGDLLPDQARQLELGSALIAVQRFDQAEKELAAIDHPVARNNLALAHFARGQIERARDEWEACWRAVPGNLFALERAVTAHMWLGGRTPPDRFETALASGVARRPEDAAAQLAALAVLDRIDAAEAVYRANAAHDWWGENLVTGWFHYVGAYLAWRQGDKEAGFNRLEATHGAAPEFKQGEATTTTLLQSVLTKATPSWAIGDVSAWWPLANLLALPQSAAQTDAQLVAALGLHPPHPDYLVLMATHAGEVGRSLALSVLKGMAESGDDAAVDALKRLLSVPCGPDTVRHSIHTWLLNHGFLQGGDAFELFTQGELRTVTPLQIEIHAEFTPDRELQPADAEQYERALELATSGKTGEALARFESLHRAYPHSARLMTALANVKRALKHPLSEIESLVHKAWEIDPDYLFARTGMTCLLADQGAVEAAREVIAPLLECDRFHYSEWRSCLGAQLAIAHATGDTATIISLREQLADLERQF